MNFGLGLRGVEEIPVMENFAIRHFTSRRLEPNPAFKMSIRGKIDEANKELLESGNKKDVFCRCGKLLRRSSLKKHLETEDHKSAILDQLSSASSSAGSSRSS